MKKIKIGYIISHLENSGPVNILFNLIKYLDRRYFEIYIYTLIKEKRDSRYDEFIKQGVIVKKLNINNREIILKKLSKIEKIIKDDRIDILHSHCLRSNFILANLDLKIKKICTIHAFIEEDYKFKFGKIKGKILEYVYLYTLKRINIKICCSRFVYEKMKSKTKERLIYITNGIDLEKYKSTKSKEESRSKLGISLKDTIFITTGSLCERKDPLFIAKNISKINLKNYKLYILGEGKLKLDIEKLRNPNIILTGKINDISEYLNAADYYISASNSEGMANSILEASAFKLPMVLSAIPSHLEFYNYSKECGVIFKKEKQDDLVNKINEIVMKNYKEISIASYKIVKEKLNAKNMSKLYSKYYCLFKERNGK